jgi:hypothetical protein
MKTKVLYESARYRVVVESDILVIAEQGCGTHHFVFTAVSLAIIEAAHHLLVNDADKDAAFYHAYVWLKAHLNTLPSVQNVTPTQWSIVTQRGDGPHLVTRQEDGGYWLRGVRYDTLSSAVASVMEGDNA